MRKTHTYLWGKGRDVWHCYKIPTEYSYLPYVYNSICNSRWGIKGRFLKKHPDGKKCRKCESRLQGAGD
jgi:hypothetical protein